MIIQAATHGGNYDYILGGRFVTGRFPTPLIFYLKLNLRKLRSGCWFLVDGEHLPCRSQRDMPLTSVVKIVPLYNAELAPAEIRGALVALQQLAICFGIMISYWITYGTNYIGGTGDTQSRAAWLVPITIQILPALILAVGIMFLPQSPRWAMDQGRDDECLQILAGLRNQPADSQLVQLEYLEIKAQKLFETRVSAHDHPTLQDGSAKSNFLLGLAQYKSLITNRSNFKRTMVAVLVMTFQQWTGINFILYDAKERKRERQARLT